MRSNGACGDRQVSAARRSCVGAGRRCRPAGVIAEPGGHAERKVSLGNRRVIGLFELRSVVGFGRAPVRVRRHDCAQIDDGCAPAVKERLRVSARRVGHVDQLEAGAPRPQSERLLGEPAERDDRLQVRPLRGVENLVSPRGQFDVPDDRRSGTALGRDEGEAECIQAEIRARQPQLREKALHALARVPDQRAPGDPLGRSRVRRDTQDASRPIEPAAVEDRPPVKPEVIAERRVVGTRVEQVVKGLWRPGIELPHRSSLV